MVNGDKRIFVTRREFYGGLALVWAYIMLVISELIRREWRWTMGLLLLASCVVTILFSVLAFRSSRMGATGNRNALSNRVKELAADPARKIEAIQVYREETGASLADAKEAVEAFINSK
jgi:hypothetical protein